MKNNSGQSLIEMVFSVAVVSVVIVGVVSLMANTMGVKNKSLDRKKAAELGNIVVEELVEEKLQDPTSFWKLTNSSNQSKTGFEGYVYSITFTKVVSDGCRTDINDCADAVINITWNSGVDSLSVARFFARRI